MAQLLLHRRNVCFVLKRVGGRHRAQAVHAEAVDRDLRLHGICEHDLVDAVRCDGNVTSSRSPDTQTPGNGLLLSVETSFVGRAMKTLDVSQATAAAHAGGVLSAILKAEGGSFFVELETRTAGVAVLVTSNNRRPRAFRNPIKALEVIRELGLQTGRFSLEAWRPGEADSERPSRPDRAQALKQTHTSAAAYDTWVRGQVQESMDDPRPSIEHADVMKKAQTRIEAMRKGGRAKA